MKTFALRVDLESEKGISKGLPKILDLLKEFNFKASFYITIGGESNIIEFIRYRGKIPTSGERRIKVFSVKEKIQMVLLPMDFATKNRIILNRILEEGHELGIHGWKHREWTRGLDKINIKKTINKCIRKYKQFFGKKPISFATPGFNINNKVLDILDCSGLRIISDYEGEKPFKIKGTEIINVPITINGKNNTPIIEYLFSIGLSDKEIYNYLIKEIEKREFSSIYIHDLFECIEKINLLRNLFNYLKKRKIKVSTIQEIAESKNFKMKEIK